ncbi:hypothetical protein JCM8547_000109 [Rhodosporidiobolus lusitaniae]
MSLKDEVELLMYEDIVVGPLKTEKDKIPLDKVLNEKKPADAVRLVVWDGNGSAETQGKEYFKSVVEVCKKLKHLVVR